MREARRRKKEQICRRAESIRSLIGRSARNAKRSTAYPRFAFSRVQPFRILEEHLRGISLPVGDLTSAKRDEDGALPPIPRLRRPRWISRNRHGR